MSTQTSRELTAHIRDLIYQLVEDDPKRAEMMLELHYVADPGTASGAARRKDIEEQLFDLTDYAKQARTSFRQMVVSRFNPILAVFAAASLYVFN